jgi:hypothetical protein
MKRIYLLSFVAALFIVACTPKAAENAEDAATETIVTATNSSYETVIIKDKIPSPQKEMRGKIGNETITVSFGSPSVKGRTVWGDLVPYDVVWRTGANEATTFESAKDLSVQGEKLAAGKYGVFTIPSESGEWTVIFNSVYEQWGAYEYDESKDVLRVKATSKTLEKSVEGMDFVVEGNSLVLKWEKLALPIQLEW